MTTNGRARLSPPSPSRVFCCHSSADKAAVLALAGTLGARGIDVWVDRFEIRPGADFVAAIDEALEESRVGLVCLSESTRDSGWVRAEMSYLFYARIKEGKPLIPVQIGAAPPWVPPLLRPLDRVPADDIDRLVAAIEGRIARPPLGIRARSLVHRFRLRVERDEAVEEGLRVSALLDDRPIGDAEPRRIARSLRDGVEELARGADVLDPRRGPPEAVTKTAARRLDAVAEELRELLLPGDVGEALEDLLDGAGSRVGTEVEIVLEASDPWTLGLPFEALRRRHGGLLLRTPALSFLRRPRGIPESPREPLAGPLKVLVAVAAPDETSTGSPVLDLERELQNILDAVESEVLRESAEVQILEVGHPDPIRAALKRDQHHVLHLSCHGRPGVLELEDEEGNAVPVAAAELVAALRESGRALPLVFLSACHGGRGAGEGASLAHALLAAGVPGVVAMLGPVGDFYASELAREFYAALAADERPRASRALALARRRLEETRQRALAQGTAPIAEVHPEYAAAAFFAGADEEMVLLERGLEKEPFRERPAPVSTGPVPELKLGDLVGRRSELRRILRLLRGAEYAGAIITGTGGVGKSALAGRVMKSLGDKGWVVAAHQGPFGVAAIATAAGTALLAAAAGRDDLGSGLVAPQLDDPSRLALLGRAIGRERPRLLLVLDDFEQNLLTGGGAWRDPSVLAFLGGLLRQAGHGRVLVTSRHRLPGLEPLLHEVTLGALSPAQTRKFVRRLPALHRRPTEDLVMVLRAIGGHPRVLEFLDGLLRGGGQARLPIVREKLARLAEASGLDLARPRTDLGVAMREAIALGARDVFLEELLSVARAEGHDEVLLHAAVSGLPVPRSGLARMLDEAGCRPRDLPASIRRLTDMSVLLGLGPDDVWVHRWTAEGLARLVPEAAHRERANRAGRYRWWRVEHETHSITDGIEAVRNHLDGGDLDEAVAIAGTCIGALRRFQQSAEIAALAGEVLARLPETHAGFGSLADEEGQALLALGFTSRAFERYEALTRLSEARVVAEPGRADYQRGLSVSCNKMGVLYQALGQGEKAREAFQKALAIAERLAEAEPDRADYQRDLSVSYERMGDLYQALGQGEKAREAFQKALAIRERLAEAEPDRADYQRDLSVSCNKMGDLYQALGQGEKAREAFQKDLAIAERLAEAEPDRADYQRDLSVSYNKMGVLYQALGQGEKAREAFQEALAIRERLAEAEPDRADYQRDLSVSYERMGDLYQALGQGEKAREAFQKALAIAKRLAEAEPDRADYQRDLSVSYNKMGDLYRALGQGEKAREAFQEALAIRERLAEAEPDRADYQRDLSVSYERMGDLYQALGQGEKAREAFQKALAIRERLAEAEPDRADYQRDLATSCERIATLGGVDAGRWLERSVALRRGVLALAPDQAILRRELAIALCQMGQLAEDPSVLLEGATILVDLRRRNALEAQYHGFADQLAPLVENAGTSRADAP